MAKKLQLVSCRSVFLTGSCISVRFKFFSIFFVHCKMPKASHISLADKGAIIAATKSGARNVGCGSETNRSQGLKITPSYLKSLYESMPRRMKPVVDAQGGHTKY